MILIKKNLWLLCGLLLITNIGYYFWHNHVVVHKVVAPNNALEYKVSNLKLLSEASEELVEIPSQTESNKTCLFLGEFTYDEIAQNLKQRLLSFDIEAKVIELKQDSSAIDYLVYLSPNASEQAAKRQLQELKTKDIEGYIINSGNLIYGISLGIFPNRDAAEVQLQKLRDADYSPRLHEQKRESNVFWLQIQQTHRALLDDIIFEQLAHDFGQLNQSFMPCK